jgi:hypothetical protein
VVDSPELNKNIMQAQTLYDNKEAILLNEKSENDRSKDIQNESLVRLGSAFPSLAEVHEAVDRLSDTSLARFVRTSSWARKGIKIPKRKISYKCCYGVLRKSTSLGIRQSSMKYVGCPAALRINQQNDGSFLVVRADLEHKEHGDSQEAYNAKIRKRLSKDQEAAVITLLETDPTNHDIAQLLCELTGYDYSTQEARNIKAKLINKNNHC